MRRIKKEEVSSLLEQVLTEQRAERVWQEMISLEPETEDALEEIEENLRDKPHEHNHNLRGWKFFGK